MATIGQTKALSVLDAAAKVIDLYDKGQIEEAHRVIDSVLRETVSNADASRIGLMTRRLGELVAEYGLDDVVVIHDEGTRQWYLSEGHFRVGVRTLQAARRALSHWPLR